MQVREKLRALNEAIPIDDEELEHIKDMLSCAEVSCNGTPDKMQSISETQGHIALILAKSMIREESRITAIVTQAVQAHSGACPLRGGASGKFAGFYPFRWPITAIICTSIIVMGGERVYNLIQKRMNSANQQASMVYEPSN